MLYFGCLTLLLVGVFLIAINLVSGLLSLVGRVALYLWDSLRNLLRPRSQRRPVRNPFSTSSSTQAASDTTAEADHETRSSRRRGKLYSASDGEYIDFEEV
jgi:hypothetical protein